MQKQSTVTCRSVHLMKTGCISLSGIHRLTDVLLIYDIVSNGRYNDAKHDVLMFM